MDKPLTAEEKQALNLQQGRESAKAAKKERDARVQALLNQLQQLFPKTFGSMILTVVE